MSTGPADTGSVYLCIDLKCFYASVECADRGLDPFRTNLVVADSCRGKGTWWPTPPAAPTPSALPSRRP